MRYSFVRQALCAAGAVLLLAGFAGCNKNPIEPEAAPTNVAEIRSLVLDEEPGANTDTELSASLRAKTLKGIVVSDKSGGNCQPFIVNIVDDSGKAGSGLALVISEENNDFVPGDVIEVSLSDATAQFYNGLLQVATNNAPVAVEKVEAPEPVVITASRLADYESQYVMIEHTQPAAGETGTWNSSSNKGNVSMETEDGGSWTLRTMQGASYASETIPEDKSGSVAGIAGVYNSTLQISPRSIDDIQLTEDRFTVSSTDATIEEVLAGGEGKNYRVSGAVVVGHNQRGALLEQEGYYIYAFIGSEHELADGDVVTVSGKTQLYNGLLQFSSGCSVEKTGTAEVSLPQPESYGAAEIEAYMEKPEIKYVSYSGYLYKSGNYTNVDIEGSSIMGSLDYMSEEYRDQYNGHDVTITGWLFGGYSSYMYTIPVVTEDHGEHVDDMPEGAIYYNTFDKEVSSETFGDDGGSWPYLDQFDGWRNEMGSGISGVSYDYEHMSVRSNQSSEGYLSTYEGSGKNNIFFSTAPNHFTIGNIAVNGRDFKLSFGAQRYSQGGNNTFLKSNFEVRVSVDGSVWSQALDYDFALEDDPGQWRLAELNFTMPEDASTLYIRFEALQSSVNRIDDVLLTAGDGGQQVVLGGDEELEVSAIADVLAGPVDTKYKIEGQVIATHTKGFLVKDDSGIILVFKSVDDAVPGSYVTVEGPTTTYGKLPQFDGTSEVTVTGSGSWTNPVPEEWGAEEFESYAAMDTPSIEYVTYTGTLTSYRDEIWQWHYNVEIEGTDVLGTLSYPESSLNVDGLVDREVTVAGWVIGVTGADEYVSTMVTSLEATDKETMPDENEAMSVSELYDVLDGLADEAELGEYVAVKGYVAANNEGGNLYNMLSLVDNTGEARSGLILYGADYTDEDFPVGSYVVVSLKYAKLDIYNGLYEIKNSTIFDTGKSAEIVVPEIDAADAADYLGQYVTVKDLTPAEGASTWVVDNATTNTVFTDASGDSVTARVTRYAEFKDETISHVTADLSGVMQVYRETYQLFPTSYEDVAGFKAE